MTAESGETVQVEQVAGIETKEGFYVRCMCCGVATKKHKTKAEAIEAWNRRVSDAD